MPSHKFESVLVRPAGTGTWTYLEVPFDTNKEFGTKAKIPVKGTVDNRPYKSTLLPNGAGNHFLVVKKDIRDAIGKSAGQKVSVTMEHDSAPKLVAVPADLSRALKGNVKANAAFGKMAYSHQKAYVEWITEAKKQETREQRVSKTVEMIAKGSRLR